MTLNRYGSPDRAFHQRGLDGAGADEPVVAESTKKQDKLYL